MRLGLLIDKLVSAHKTQIVLSGTDSSLAIAPLLAQRHDPAVARLPQVVVVSDAREAENFIEALDFFKRGRTAQLLPSFDVGLYSNLYPNARLISQRMGWLYAAQNADGGDVFVATIEALLQLTLPFEVLARHTFSYSQKAEFPSPHAKFLEGLGYANVPLVEDVGTYSIRGGIIDIFSPAHSQPVRLELFGDQIDSMKFFNPETQRSTDPCPRVVVVPPREVLYSDEARERAANQYRESVAKDVAHPEDVQTILHSIVQGHYFQGVDFLLPYFYEKLQQPLEHFSQPVQLWLVDPLKVTQTADLFWREQKEQFAMSESLSLRVDYRQLYTSFDDLSRPPESVQIDLTKIIIEDNPEPARENEISYRTYSIDDFAKTVQSQAQTPITQHNTIREKLMGWTEQGHRLFVAAHTVNQAQRLKLLFDKSGVPAQILSEDEQDWESWLSDAPADVVRIIPRSLGESLRFQEESFILFRDDDFFGRRRHHKKYKDTGSLERRTHALSFGDLKPGDLVVHSLHGIGIYDGLKIMPINGVNAEFIQLKYKDNDRLYLPVYRVGQIQKYSGPSSERLIDKLGGTGWQKTKTKVKKHLRDLASDLLKLYAQRSQLHRPGFSGPDEDFLAFETGFPYTETADQLSAIDSVIKDMTSEKPMDRLVCGDVGFGKTEIAMRATFKAVQDRKQVAILAPTTILTFQHLKTFTDRFSKWPIRIKALNRFVSSADAKTTLAELQRGEIDVIIGTHRLLSKDVQFKDLGLLIIDEEQKFGVLHKEKIRKIKTGVDTLALSATPIPRTLNMSLVGLRDLSIITTPPEERLPTRTFVCRFDQETIRKATLNEVSRGGQVFFLHNRVQSIYNVADELRSFLPNVRIAVAHGQMPEDELEKTMVRFFNQEIDMLICTAIIESGMDIPKANTMFIDNAQTFGVSQLYQLRGRVGRSKERAYCYLLIPPNRRLEKEAQERLRVIQENTALGSGVRVAHYDLELRGAGDILGEDQSGHIDAVGYELYMELLEDAIHAEKGEPQKGEQVEPEINVRIPAFIPDNYISDIRIRLAYYKALSEIEGPEDLDRIESELRDQFGKLPDEVLNLLGMMLIRKYCKDLGIKDISSGKNIVSLSFSEKTPVKPATVIEMSSRENKKYAITPDNRFNIRMHDITWPKIYDELVILKRSCLGKD